MKDIKEMTPDEQAEVCCRRITQKMEVICEKKGVTPKEMAATLVDFGNLPWHRRIWFRLKIWWNK